MEPELLDRPIRWDPVFRSTFLCFHTAIAEGARLFGHLIDDLMCEAHLLGPGVYGRSALRAVALDLYHLDRFLGMARLDLAAARRRIGAFAQMIAKALKENIRPQRQTPAFRESFLVCLPEETQRAARLFGAHLQAAVAEPAAAKKPRQALEGAVEELDFLAAQLAEMARDDEAEERLARFAGRMAQRVEALSESLAGQSGVPGGNP